MTEIDQQTDARDPFEPTFAMLNKLIADGVKPRSQAIAQAAELTGVDLQEFRRHFRELAKRDSKEPGERAEKGARFAPKLDGDAKEALRKLAVLNSVGLAPTVDEITIGATDHASQQASRWVVAQYEKATASMKKIDQ